MDLSLHALRYFVAVAEELHFGRAAQRLRLTAPTVSEQISRLETKLGVGLFRRTSRRVELTPDGLELLALARTMLADHDRILAWAEDKRRRQEPVLRVGFVGANSVITEIIGSAARELPGIRLETRQLSFTGGITALLDGEVDAAFVPGPVPPLPGRLRCLVVDRDRRVLVLPAGHPLAQRDSVGIAELGGETFIAAAGPAEVVNWWVVDPRPDGSAPRRGPVAHSLEEMLELCAAGLGVNLAPESVAVYNNRPDLRYVPVPDIPPADVVLCTPVEPGHPLTTAFVRIAHRHARDTTT
ncbi:LysR family transcriptional regulator [Nocardia aurantia]|uniref:HTH-type transcriptional regulator GltC n=1 Tax=Nocardia aurantia TaxID=2585199 RepID=A0A7K0E2B8_9NOCA|nr:LysR family transcriptional regulator [Nocardia aurantia]MQY31294.1 HTH-type transcriptional regulator GltC [Nocardia aurantia]